METLKIFYTNDNTHIQNSYLLIARKVIIEKVNDIIIERRLKDYQVTRNINSYVREWIGHNRLYRLGLFKSHTKHVDLEENMPKWKEIIWFILGGI